MIVFPRYYIRISNGVTDAIAALKDHRPKDALEILVEAYQDAEDMFMYDDEDAEKLLKTLYEEN